MKSNLYFTYFKIVVDCVCIRTTWPHGAMDASVDATKRPEILTCEIVKEPEKDLNLQENFEVENQDERGIHKGNFMEGSAKERGKSREQIEGSDELVEQTNQENARSWNENSRSGNDHVIHNSGPGINGPGGTDCTSGREGNKVCTGYGETITQTVTSNNENVESDRSTFIAVVESEKSKEEFEALSRAEIEGKEDSDETHQKNRCSESKNAEHGENILASHANHGYSDSRLEEGEKGKEIPTLVEEVKKEDDNDDDWEDLIDEDFKNFYSTPRNEPKRIPTPTLTVSVRIDTNTRKGRKILKMVRKHVPLTWKPMPLDAPYRWFDVPEISTEFFCVTDPIRKCNLIALQARRLQNPYMFANYMIRRQELITYYCEVDLECVRYLCVDISDIETIALNNVDYRLLGLRKRDAHLYSTPCKAIIATYVERPVMVVCRCIRPGIKSTLLNEIYPEYVINFRGMIKEKDIKTEKRIPLSVKYEDNIYISPL